MRMILYNVILVAGIGLLLLGCGSDKKAETPKPKEPQVSKATGYIVTPQLLSQDIEVPGSLAAFEEVELHPEVSGRVIAVYFKEGSTVGQGSLLLKLYDGDLQAHLQSNYLRL